MPPCRSSWATWRSWPGGMFHLTPDLQAKAAALPALYADHRGGFYATVHRLQADPNLTPQQANVLMAKVKADIPVLEADMAAVAEACNRIEEQGSAQAVKHARDARMVIAVVVLAAIVLAGLLGAALYRSSAGPFSGKGYAACPTGI